MRKKPTVDLTSTDYRKNPYVPEPSLRPKCTHPGCTGSVHISTVRKDGSPCYRKSGLCATHHSKAIALRHGVKSAGHLTAQRQGFTVTEYRNTSHPYRKYRKDYCENVDGRLGYKCTTTIFWEGMLDVDHKNGKPNDNRPRNLQTLCKCCHAYKTNKSRDYATIGRKKLKETGKTMTAKSPTKRARSATR